MEAAIQAAVQAPQPQVQQAAGYYRTQTGASGMKQVSGGQPQANPFGEMLDRVLSGGAQPTDEAGMLLEMLEQTLQEDGEADQDAVLQLLAQMLAGQQGFVQQIDPALLAQLTGQTATGAQPVNTLQQSMMTAMLWQQPVQGENAAATLANSALQGALAQDGAFAADLAQQMGLEVVQTVTAPQSEAQNALLFGEAGYQRALYQAQQQMGAAPVANASQGTQTQAEGIGTMAEQENMQQAPQAKGDKQTQQPETALSAAQQPRVFTLANESTQAVAQEAKVDAEALLAQVKTGLLDGTRKGEDNFVIRLKPEGLGEITVRMAQQDGKINVSILATNQQTQRLLSSELVNLRQAMEPYNVVVNAQQADGGNTAFNLEQQMRQGFAQQQQQHSSAHNFALQQDDADEELYAPAAWTTQAASGLDAYI